MKGDCVHRKIGTIAGDGTLSIRKVGEDLYAFKTGGAHTVRLWPLSVLASACTDPGVLTELSDLKRIPITMNRT